jgi:hypothetical protein
MLRTKYSEVPVLCCGFSKTYSFNFHSWVLHPVACIIRITMNTVYWTVFYLPLFFIVLSVTTCFSLTDHHQAIHIQLHENYWTYNSSVVFTFSFKPERMWHHISFSLFVPVALCVDRACEWQTHYFINHYCQVIKQWTTYCLYKNTVTGILTLYTDEMDRVDNRIWDIT